MSKRPGCGSQQVREVGRALGTGDSSSLGTRASSFLHTPPLTCPPFPFPLPCTASKQNIPAPPLPCELVSVAGMAVAYPQYPVPPQDPPFPVEPYFVGYPLFSSCPEPWEEWTQPWWCFLVSVNHSWLFLFAPLVTRHQFWTVSCEESLQRSFWEGLTCS